MVLAGHLVEFGVGLAADGAHGGAQRVLTLFDGCDPGLDWVEIDKPGFEDGLRHGFEGLVDAVVKVYLRIKRVQNPSNCFLYRQRRNSDLCCMKVISVNARNGPLSE